jgi:O-antigen/teichoic acid export membrane protein
VLVLPVVTRLLDPDAYGSVAAATVVAQLLGLVATLGLNGSVMLEFFADRRDPGPARRLVGAAALAAVALAGLADVTGPLWANVFADLSYGTELRLAVWTAAPLAVLASGQAMLRSRGRAGPYVLATVTASAGGHAIGAALVAVTDGGSTAYLTGVLIGASTGALLALVFGGVERPRRSDHQLVVRALRVGLPLVPHVVAMFALLAVDRIVIEQVLGLEAAGRYQIASLIGCGGLSLLAAINNAWSPMVLGAEPDRRWSILAESTRDLEHLAPALVAAIALPAPVLLAVAAPASYDPLVLARVTAVVAASTLPYLWYLSGVHVVLFHRRTGVMARITPLVALGSVAANLVLLPTVGLTGAAFVTVAAYATLAWRVRRAARRRAQVPWDHDSSRRAAVLVVAVVAGALALPTAGLGGGLRVLLAVLVAASTVRRLIRSGPKRQAAAVSSAAVGPSAAATG